MLVVFIAYPVAASLGVEIRTVAVVGIADSKSTMPMLANVLLRTQGKNQLLVAATDLTCR